MVSLSSKRRSSVFTLAATAAAALYVVMAFVAEPAGALAVTDNFDVEVNVPDTLNITCGSTVSLGDLVPGTSTTLTKTGSCTVITNNPTGYTLKWQVLQGSGGAVGSSNFYGTGHLNSYIHDANIIGGLGTYTIRALGDSDDTTPVLFNTSNNISAGDVRWAARVTDASESGGASVVPDFGTDSGSEDDASRMFLHVATGAAFTIVNATDATDSNGEIEYFDFRVVQDDTNVIPATVYKARVTFTATNN